MHSPKTFKRPGYDLKQLLKTITLSNVYSHSSIAQCIECLRPRELFAALSSSIASRSA